MVAGLGIWTFLRRDRHGKIHLLVAATALVLGYILNLQTTEWLLILVCIGGVVALEMINASIEHLADFVQSEHDHRIKNVKDIAAGAVLWQSIISLIIGICIFLPKIINQATLP